MLSPRADTGHQSQGHFRCFIGRVRVSDLQQVSGNLTGCGLMSCFTTTPYKWAADADVSTRPGVEGQGYALLRKDS
jgi:hypothetical protein